MRKLLILPIIVLIVFSSCKKDNQGVPLGTLKATIDGIPVVFNMWDTAIIGVYNLTLPPSPPSVTYSLNIHGYTSDTLKNIDFGVNGYLSITAGTYIDSLLNLYNLSSSIFYNQGLTTSGYVTYVSTGNTTSYSIINITSIDSASVQGTFNGLVTLSTPGTSLILSHTITNGQFNLPLIHW